MKVSLLALVPLVALGAHAAAIPDHTARDGHVAVARYPPPPPPPFDNKSKVNLAASLGDLGLPTNIVDQILEAVKELLADLLGPIGVDAPDTPDLPDLPDLRVRDATAGLDAALVGAGVPSDIIGQVVEAVKNLLAELLGPLGDVLPVPVPALPVRDSDKLEKVLVNAGVPKDILGDLVKAIKELLGDLLGPLHSVLPVPLPGLPIRDSDKLEKVLVDAGAPTDILGDLVEAVKELLGDLLGPLTDVLPVPLPALPIGVRDSNKLEMVLLDAGVPKDILGDIVEAVKNLLAELLGPLGDVLPVPIPALPIRARNSDKLEKVLLDAGVPKDILGDLLEAVKELLGDLLGPLTDVLPVPVPALPIKRAAPGGDFNTQLTTELQGMGLDQNAIGGILTAVNGVLGGALTQALGGLMGGLPLPIVSGLIPQ